MTADIFTPPVLQSMARGLSVTDLIRTTETLKQSGQARASEALYATWIEQNPQHALLYAILFNYSVALSDSGKLAEARQCLERAISLNADFMPAYINLGRVCERLGTPAVSLAQWSAVAAKLSAVTGAAISHKITALNQSARVLEAGNQDEAAEELLRQSLDVDSRQREVVQHFLALRQRQCKWPVIVPWERADRATLLEGMSPLSAGAFTDDPMLQLAMAWNYNLEEVGSPAGVRTAWESAQSHRGPLRIGYISSDMREHAVGYLIAEVFPLHDRRRVEVFAYYCGIPSKDPLHEHFKRSADHWVDISGLDDDAAARRIAQDGVQILVDLNGYTRDARVKLVALRPAPVIVNWLGYPGTMASPYHHYLIADDWIVPPESEPFYSEKVLRLPCYQPNNRQRTVAPRCPTRTEVGLPEQGMVYCCFNGAHKINRFTFDRWLSILSRVPGSVLWLMGGNDGTNQRLRDYAVKQGIAGERIIFADKLANPFHLARYVLADLFLDTTPYGAHTTASDALWMGVPMLTWSGRSFASRVCGSLVRSAGLPELVCASAEEFVERAVEFGLHPESLMPYRERLRENRGTCPLFDTPALVRHLEELFQQMWDEFQQGTIPEPSLANLEPYLEVGARFDHEQTEVQGIADYRGWWQSLLAERNRSRPIQPDRRLAQLA
jgi:predicted O-linked N-acetylglucosamine transferase (SPINDLY family)